MISLTKDRIQAAIQAKNYAWFDKGLNTPDDYNLNIVGIRTSSPGSRITNVFDDILTLSYKVQGQWVFHSWAITTDPGLTAARQCKNPKGVAILVPGQYRGCYILRPHANTYLALGQDRPVRVFRDSNKNSVFDMNPNTIEQGLFGINIHRARPKGDTELVNTWSEGCQVFKRVRDFNLFLSICQTSAKLYSNRFTYTLLTLSDLSL